MQGIQASVFVGRRSDLSDYLVTIGLLAADAPTLSELERARAPLPPDVVIAGSLPWRRLPSPIVVIEPVVRLDAAERGRHLEWDEYFARLEGFGVYRVEPFHSRLVAPARQAVDRLVTPHAKHEKVLRACLRLSSEVENWRDAQGSHVRHHHVAGSRAPLRVVGEALSWTYLPDPVAKQLGETAWLDPSAIESAALELRTITVKRLFLLPAA